MIMIDYFLNIFDEILAITMNNNYFYPTANNSSFLNTNSVCYSRQLIYYEFNFRFSNSNNTINVGFLPLEARLLETGIPPLDDLCSFLYDPLDKKDSYNNLVSDSFSALNYGKTAPIFKGENECSSFLSSLGNFLFKIFFFWSTPPSNSSWEAWMLFGPNVTDSAAQLMFNHVHSKYDLAIVFNEYSYQVQEKGKLFNNNAFLDRHFYRYKNSITTSTFKANSVFFTDGSFINLNETLGRFPRRNYRLNVLQKFYFMFPHTNEYLFFDWHNKWSPSIYSRSKIRPYSNLLFSLLDGNNYSGYFNRDFERKRYLVSYISYLNEQMTSYIRNLYKDNTLFYHISALQVQHLLQMSYEDIQYILMLMNTDPYFQNRTFFDVQWELYNGVDLSHSKPGQNFFVSSRQNNIILLNSEFNYYQFCKNFFNNKLFSGFYNPFELLTFGEHLNDKPNKTYFFSEDQLKTLPIHLLINSEKPMFLNDTLFSIDIYNRAKSSTYLNLFFGSGDVFANKLYRYAEFSKYSKLSLTSNLVSDIEYLASYKRSYNVLHNPWWDCLTFETKFKLEHLQNNIDFERFHLVMVSLIDRFLEGRSFFTMDDVNSICEMNGRINNNSFNLVKDNFYPKLGISQFITIGPVEYGSFYVNSVFSDLNSLFSSLFSLDRGFLNYYTNSIFLSKNNFPFIFGEVIQKNNNNFSLREYILLGDGKVKKVDSFKFYEMMSNYYETFFSKYKLSSNYPRFYKHIVQQNSSFLSSDFYINNNNLNLESLKKSNHFSFFFSEKDFINLIFLNNLEKEIIAHSMGNDTLFFIDTFFNNLKIIDSFARNNVGTETLYIYMKLFPDYRFLVLIPYYLIALIIFGYN